ncbi:acetoin utilization protein AcuC [Paenibacillus cymbidii]|uniref:acetoin utilization protein AcuC n=1 Tax=Paenibacillus cymbidii TaxID=1639034 RepID=UPI001A9BD543|nr:acetoin utilization protein AcuC [Paenibacillus cymbidii]
MDQAAFIYHPDELKYRFPDDHPFNQQRLALTADLLRSAGALADADVFAPRMATADELALVHTDEFVRAVRALSDVPPPPEWLREADRFGLGDGDTPFFPHMHEAASNAVGGTLRAAELVMSGARDHALHLGGGLHHAFPNKAAGFCVYNDASVAIAHLRKHHQARVLYVDTDVHHGDGVEFAFYSDPDVCTFSIHETGKFLYPGTGMAAERGNDLGFGATVNIPVEPYTEDESWLECFETPLRRTIAGFRPDIIVSQHGCDAHAFDPLAHIHCSMAIYRRMPQVIHELAHAYCGGRWLALGGGGYDIWRVVPRAWSLVWMAMTDHPLIAALGERPDLPLPEGWADRWQPHSPDPLPAAWLDPVQDWEPMPRRSQIAEKNRQVMEHAMLYLPNLQRSQPD